VARRTRSRTAPKNTSRARAQRRRRRRRILRSPRLQARLQARVQAGRRHAASSLVNRRGSAAVLTRLPSSVPASRARINSRRFAVMTRLAELRIVRYRDRVLARARARACKSIVSRDIVARSSPARRVRCDVISMRDSPAARSQAHPLPPSRPPLPARGGTRGASRAREERRVKPIFVVSARRRQTALMRLCFRGYPRELIG